jgi:eukaryotic-like serine/threonine-protein kinase
MWRGPARITHSEITLLCGKFSCQLKQVNFAQTKISLTILMFALEMRLGGWMVHAAQNMLMSHGSTRLNEAQAMHAMILDDAYRVERVMSDGVSGKTELVTIDGAGPFVRKKIPAELARRRVWSTLLDCNCARLPHIEATYELPETFVVVYDYVAGDQLEHQVETDGLPTPERAAELTRQVCEAAQALHGNGIVHRDITPRNIIVSADGAHLIDTGIARMYVEGSTRDTASLGTWGYASPEQYGFAQSDARADVYSIGRVLGYLLTGVHPGDDGYDEALADESAVSVAHRSIVLKACAFEPSSRFQSAAEMAQALEAGVAVEVPEPVNVAPGKAAGVASGAAAGVVAASAGDAAGSAGATSRSSSAPVPPTDFMPAHGGGSGDEGNAPAEPSAADVDKALADKKRSRRKPAGKIKLTPAKALFALAALMLIMLGVVMGVASLAGYGLGRWATIGPASCSSSQVQSGSTSNEANAFGTTSAPDTSDTQNDAASTASSAGVSSSSTSNSSSGTKSGSTGASSTIARTLEQGYNPALVAKIDSSVSSYPIAATEVAWEKSGDEFVSYSYSVTNASDEQAVYAPTIKITGKDADGGVAFSCEDVLSYIGPGQTVYFSSIAKIGDSQVSTVGVAAVKPTGYHLVDADQTGAYTVTNITRASDEFGHLRFTGEVRTDSDPSDGAATQIAIKVVLRDADGKLLSVGSGYIAPAAVGESTAFEVSFMSSKITDYATVEAYAVAW